MQGCSKIRFCSDHVQNAETMFLDLLRKGTNVISLVRPSKCLTVKNILWSDEKDIEDLDQNLN